MWPIVNLDISKTENRPHPSEQGEVLNDEVVPFDPNLIPIHTAAMFGQVEVVKFLMETYSHLNEAIDEFNLTPMEYAVVKNQRKVAKVLLCFPMRDEIKTRAFRLAIEKEMYQVALQINKWEAAGFIFYFIFTARVGRCNIALIVLIIINSSSNQHGVSYNVTVHEWKYLIKNRYMYY